MLSNVKKIIPYTIKRKLQNIYQRFKYGMSIGRGSHVHKTVLESDCKISHSSSLMDSSMGRASYIGDNTAISSTKIGKYCCIGNYVSICLGNHPSRDFVSIHPCFYSLNGNSTQSYVNKQLFKEHKFVDGKHVCVIGNDVWIGNNVNILDGITIGDGAIIATGAIVTKDVEAYSIVGGIPAKLISHRFSQKEIAFLLKLKWWDFNESWLKENSSLFSDIKLMMNFFDKNKKN